MRVYKNIKGQAIISEYVMIFFIVIAVLMAMVTFIQRGLQARINDTRDFAMGSAANALVNGCGSNCLVATGNSVAYEYEPYYAQMSSQVSQTQNQDTGLTPAANGEIFIKNSNDTTSSESVSIQLPPKEAN